MTTTIVTSCSAVSTQRKSLMKYWLIKNESSKGWMNCNALFFSKCNRFFFCFFFGSQRRRRKKKTKPMKENALTLSPLQLGRKYVAAKGKRSSSRSTRCRASMVLAWRKETERTNSAGWIKLPLGTSEELVKHGQEACIKQKNKRRMIL